MLRLPVSRETTFICVLSEIPYSRNSVGIGVVVQWVDSSLRMPALHIRVPGVSSNWSTLLVQILDKASSLMMAKALVFLPPIWETRKVSGCVVLAQLWALWAFVE